MGRLVVVATILGTSVLVACSGDGPDQDRADRGAPSTVAPSNTAVDPASDVSDEPALGEPVPDETVDLGARDGIEDQLECVEDHLPEGVDPAGAPVEDAEESVGQCARLGSFGEGFGQGLRDLGLYTEPQVLCLVDAYGLLTQDEIDAVQLAGVSPAGPEADEATVIMTDLYGSCDAEVPTR